MHKLKMAATHIKTLETTQEKNSLEKMQYAEFDDDKSDCTKSNTRSCVHPNKKNYDCVSLLMREYCRFMPPGNPLSRPLRAKNAPAVLRYVARLPTEPINSFLHPSVRLCGAVEILIFFRPPKFALRNLFFCVKFKADRASNGCREG